MTDPAEVFLNEAAELLDQLEQALLDLEQFPSDSELIDTAFRALHTLKGSGAMFGFEALSSFVHDFETAFDHVRKGRVASSRDLIAIALAAKDHIRILTERPNEVDAALGDRILAELRRVLEIPNRNSEGAQGPGGSGASSEDTAAGSAGSRTAEQDQTAGKATWRLQFRFNGNVLVNGTNPLLLLDELRSLGECSIALVADAVPPLDELRPDVCYVGFDVRLTTEQPRSAIDDVFIFVADEMSLKVERLDAAAPAKEASALYLQSLLDACGQMQDDHAVTPPTRQAAADIAVAGRKDATVRVPAERVDELMDRVGELVIAQARLWQLAEKVHDLDIKAVAEEIQRLASGLRDVTMGIRMMPIGTLFGRFRRLAYDLSRDLGKPIKLTTTGEETELDKTMIERLADPLVHLIRNAVDHGLENPADRAAAGKAASGHIRLVARHAGAEVLISVSDDGRGLDTAKIRAKAEAQGLIDAGTQLSEQEIHQLIFHAGFSTADQVTKLSGRGVGMDVVKRDIEAMRGIIDVNSSEGKGTEITLRLPLTLAIIEGLLVRVGTGRYVVPLSVVEECVELSAAEDKRSSDRNFMNVRGELVPFIRLRELFDARTQADPHQKVVIVASGDLRVGLVVDQIIGNHQTVIKSLSKLHAEVASFSGATILGDGTVALILDVTHLVDRTQMQEKQHKIRDQEAA